jgi:hypothetical protein
VADQRVGSGIGFVIERQVELARVDIGAQWPADLHRLDRTARSGAAADVVDQFAKRDPERGFEQPAMPMLPASWIGIVPFERPMPRLS